MCVITKQEQGPWQCCGCCTLTSGMTTIGVLMMVAVFLCIISFNIFGAVYFGIFTIPFIFAMMD